MYGPQRGVVVAAVWIADRSALLFAKERWGDLVQVRPLLEAEIAPWPV
jgi:hypothetical protein